MPSSSFNAILKLSSTRTGDLGEFEVLSCHINTGRAYDHEGLPTGRLRAFIFEVEILITPEEVLIGSVFDSHDLVKGKIEFKKIDEDSTFRTVEFDKSWIVEYDERFEPKGDPPMICKLTISGGKITVGSASMSRTWADKV